MDTPRYASTSENSQSDAPFHTFGDLNNIDLIEAASGIGRWEWNISKDQLHLTKESCRILGRELGTSMNFADFLGWVHADDRERLLQAHEACLKGNRPLRLSFRAMLGNGSFRQVRSQGNLITSKEGKRLKLCGHIIDETDQLLKEQAIHEYERQLQQIEAVAKVGRWEWDVEQDIVTWSPEIFRFFELDPSKGAPSVAVQHLLYPPEEFARLKAALDAAVQFRVPYAIKLKRIAKDGSTWVCLARGRPFFDSEGKVAKLAGYLEDITQLEEIDQERELLRAAIKQSDEMLLITDAEEKIIYANPALEHTSGYSLDELKGNTPRVFQSGQHKREFYEGMWKVLKSGKNWRGRIMNKRKDGTLYTEEASISPVHDANGRITHFIALKYDITADIQNENKLLEAQKLESIGRLAGGVAHDFNNMLQVIIGHVEHAERHCEPESKVGAALHTIKEAARRSGNLTEQLLAFAREQTAMPKVINVGEKLESLLNMLRRILREDIDVNIDVGEEPYFISLDPVQLDQIITNLCVNARDAIEANGCICISLATAKADDAFRTIHSDMEPGEYLCIKVSDSGCGMADEVVEHIFEPFYSTKPQGQGTGLGLSTVHGIVKQNGGHIHVYSEVGVGTTFRIYFPKSTEVIDEAASTTLEVGGEEAMKGTVLIVEDEAMILELSTICLKDLGLDVVAAGSPQEALRIVQDKSLALDLVITDVVMPQMNGRRLVNEIKKTYPNIEVLYMSGYPADVVTRKGLLPAKTNFLSKPFSMEELSTKLKQLL